MSWITAIINLITALPKIIDGLREAFWLWEASRNERQKEKIEDDVKKKHDDLRNGAVPRRD